MHHIVHTVWFSHQFDQGRQNSGNRKCWRPIIIQDVETDRSILVDVRMEYFGFERALGRPERVIDRE